MKIKKLNENAKFRVNDKVFVKPNKKQGRVLKVKGDYITVEMDNGKDPIRIDTYYDTDLEAVDEITESKQLNETKYGKDELWNQINNSEWAYNTLSNKVKTAVEKGLPKERIINIVRKAIASMKDDFGRCPTTQAERLELARDFVEDELQGYSFEDGDPDVPSYKRTGTWKRLGEAFKPDNRGIQYVKCYNQYNYTTQELRVDNDNKTFERGQFTMGKPDKKTKNRQEFEDIVDTLKELGYTEIKSDYHSMRNKSRKGIPTNESIDVATIADYITDYYDFDDIDDKYSCINSIRNSFKDEKTISYEVLMQFIGAHNGRDLEDTLNLLKDEISKANDVKSIMDIASDEKFDKISDHKHDEYWNIIDDRISEIKKSMNESSNAYDYKGYTIIDTGYGCKIKDSYGKWDRVQFDTTDEAEEYIDDMKLNENYWLGDDDNLLFFDKEELIEFGEEIVDHLNEIFDSKWELTGAYVDGKEIEIEVSSDDVGTYVHSVKVDFRRIKKPSDINKYIMAFVAKFSEQIRKDMKDMMLNESLGGEYAKKILEFANRSLDNHYDITGILEIVLRYCPEDILKDAWHDKIRFLIDDTDDSDLLDDNDSKLIESASEDIPTETLAGPEEGPKAGLAELISMAIKDEWDAIETYNTLSITARAEGFEDIAAISDEIGTEENKHVGQLQAALKTISPNAEAINVGEEEGNNQLEG